MKNKRLSNKENFGIVLEGLKGLTVADICTRYGILKTIIIVFGTNFLPMVRLFLIWVKHIKRNLISNKRIII